MSELDRMLQEIDDRVYINQDEGINQDEYEYEYEYVHEIFDDCEPGEHCIPLPLSRYYGVPRDWDKAFRRIHQKVTLAYRGVSIQHMLDTHVPRHLFPWNCMYAYYQKKKSTPMPRCMLWGPRNQRNPVARYFSSYANELDDTSHNKRSLAHWMCNVFADKDLDKRYRVISGMHRDLRRALRLLIQEVLPKVRLEGASRSDISYFQDREMSREVLAEALDDINRPIRLVSDTLVSVRA